MRKLVPILIVLILGACAKKQDAAPAAGSSANAAPVRASDSGVPGPTTPSETAVAPEVNPPGDIPDTQQFVKYVSAAGGYELDVPEGWARRESGADVRFASKYDGVAVNVTKASAAPTAASARAVQAKVIASQGRAVAITGVSEINVPAGKSVVIAFTSNSEPNAVTNRQIRLENEAHLYFSNGRLATLTLWAPKGADNADQWNRMSKSFHWR